MNKETSIRVLHALGAMLHHYEQFTGIEVSELIERVVLPLIDSETPAVQVDLVRQVLNGESCAYAVSQKLREGANYLLVN